MTCVRSKKGQIEYEKITNEVIDSYRAKNPWSRNLESTTCQVHVPNYGDNLNNIQECERFSSSKVGADKSLTGKTMFLYAGNINLW
mgnify:FL=1